MSDTLANQIQKHRAGVWLLFLVLAGSLHPAPHPKAALDKSHSQEARLLPSLHIQDLLRLRRACFLLLTLVSRLEIQPHLNRGNHEAGPQTIRISPEEDKDFITVQRQLSSALGNLPVSGNRINNQVS